MTQNHLATGTSELQEVLSSLPLFPLPRLVFLPGEVLPLHVFEPRYRTLVRHVMETHGHMGIATVRDGVTGEELLGNPPLYPEVGVGRLVRHQALPDGRSNILLAFVTAARVEQELTPDTPFRQARAAALPAVALADYGEVEHLRVLAMQVASAAGPLGPREELFALRGGAWVDAMARVFVQDPAVRRQYLGARSGSERVGLLQTTLLALLQRLSSVAEA